MEVYCESCGKRVPFFIEEMHADRFPENGIWGDLVCQVCRLVICTFNADRLGPVTISIAGLPVNLKLDDALFISPLEARNG